MRPTARLAALAALVALPGTAAADGVLDRMRDTGEIRLGYRTDALPLSFADDEGIPAGYSVEVCEAVADLLVQALGLDALDLRFVAVGPDDRFDAITEGRIDLLCGAATVTLARREIVDFSIPTFVDGAAVLMPAGSDRSFDDLAGERIGVLGGTTTEEALRGALTERGIEAEVVEVDSHQAGRDMLLAGDLAAYFGDQSILIGLILTSGDPAGLTLSEDMLTVEKHALALPRGDTEFRLAVDRALSELYGTSRMAQIFEEALPGVAPGLALRALFLLAPEQP